MDTLVVRWSSSLMKTKEERTVGFQSWCDSLVRVDRHEFVSTMNECHRLNQGEDHPGPTSHVQTSNRHQEQTSSLEKRLEPIGTAPNTRRSMDLRMIGFSSPMSGRFETIVPRAFADYRLTCQWSSCRCRSRLNLHLCWHLCLSHWCSCRVGWVRVTLDDATHPSILCRWSSFDRSSMHDESSSKTFVTSPHRNPRRGRTCPKEDLHLEKISSWRTTTPSTLPLMLLRFSSKHRSEGSLVMNEINSSTPLLIGNETMTNGRSLSIISYSSMVSLAFLSFSSTPFFMIFAPLAMDRNRSCSLNGPVCLGKCCWSLLSS